MPNGGYGIRWHAASHAAAEKECESAQEVVAADALWALAGAETEGKRTVVEGIGLYKKMEKFLLSLSLI